MGVQLYSSEYRCHGRHAAIRRKHFHPRRRSPWWWTGSCRQRERCPAWEGPALHSLVSCCLFWHLPLWMRPFGGYRSLPNRPFSYLALPCRFFSVPLSATQRRRRFHHQQRWCCRRKLPATAASAPLAALLISALLDSYSSVASFIYSAVRRGAIGRPCAGYHMMSTVVT